jgi:hypothetical protein
VPNSPACESVLREIVFGLVSLAPRNGAIPHPRMPQHPSKGCLEIRYESVRKIYPILGTASRGVVWGGWGAKWSGARCEEGSKTTVTSSQHGLRDQLMLSNLKSVIRLVVSPIKFPHFMEQVHAFVGRLGL